MSYTLFYYPVIHLFVYMTHENIALCYFRLHPILHLYENIGYYRIDICSNYCAVLISILHMLLFVWYFHALFRMWHCCNLIEPLKLQLKEGSCYVCHIRPHTPLPIPSLSPGRRSPHLSLDCPSVPCLGVAAGRVVPAWARWFWREVCAARLNRPTQFIDLLDASGVTSIG